MVKGAKGFALVVALALIMVLLGVILAMAVSTIGDLRQTKSSVQHLQALAAAEAGETYAQYVLSDLAQPAFRAIFLPYSTEFLDEGGDPASEWVIPKDEWNDVARQIKNTLNTNYDTLPANYLSNGASVRIRYKISDFRGATRTATSQTYVAEYQITSIARLGKARRRVRTRGFMRIQIGRPSLSQWLFLVDDAGGQNGFFPTGSVFNGPAHANHNWGFWGQPVFTDVASTSDDGAFYYNAGGCSGRYRVWIRGDSRPPCTVPDFRKGFIRNAPEVELPTSSVSQERAALGLDPIADADGDGQPDPVSRQQRCQALGLPANCGTPDEGVYLVNDGASVSGGIYVQGDVEELVLEASGDGKQIYTFEMWINGERYRWRIVADYLNDRTTVTKMRFRGGQWETVSTTTYSGTPNGHAPLGRGGATGQIYVSGELEELTGPGRSGDLPCGVEYPGDSELCHDHPPPDVIEPALSLETQLTITARHEIGLSGDLIYECDPTKLADANYLANHPRCDLGGNPLRTVLGVMSENDDITILEGAPDNIYLWGSYLSGADGRGLAVENFSGRGRQGKMRLFGGLIQSSDKLRGVIDSNGSLASGYMETYDYDARFLDSQLVPPNFPTARYFDVQKLIPVKLSYHDY